jgi:hypothetical protein
VKSGVDAAAMRSEASAPLRSPSLTKGRMRIAKRETGAARPASEPSQRRSRSVPPALEQGAPHKTPRGRRRRSAGQAPASATVELFVAQRPLRRAQLNRTATLKPRRRRSRTSEIAWTRTAPRYDEAEQHRGEYAGPPSRARLSEGGVGLALRHLRVDDRRNFTRNTRGLLVRVTANCTQPST